eukprot:scaffold67703_cov39-Prasinocladus_malaysianus.AAC.1
MNEFADTSTPTQNDGLEPTSRTEARVIATYAAAKPAAKLSTARSLVSCCKYEWCRTAAALLGVAAAS